MTSQGISEPHVSKATDLTLCLFPLDVEVADHAGDYVFFSRDPACLG